jgi:cytochrome P450
MRRFTSRRCAEDYPIPGYEGMVVPKDAVVEIPIWYLHRDPNVYPDPEVFDPDRSAIFSFYVIEFFPPLD